MYNNLCPIGHKLLYTAPNYAIAALTANTRSIKTKRVVIKPQSSPF